MVPRILAITAVAAAILFSACAGIPRPADEGGPATEAKAASQAVHDGLRREDARTAPQAEKAPSVPDKSIASRKPPVLPVTSGLYPLPASVPLPDPGLSAATVRKVELIAAGTHSPAAPAEVKTVAAPPKKEAAAMEQATRETARKQNSLEESKPRPPVTKPETGSVRPAPAASERAPEKPQEKPKETPKEAAKTAVPLKEAEVTGEVGKAVKVMLPGIGWIYLGDDENSGKIRYQGKTVEGGNTIFSFIAYSAGNYLLKFQQQDLTVNSVRQNDVSLRVEPPKPPTAAKDHAVPPKGAEPYAKPALPEKTMGRPSADTGLGGLETDDERMRELLKEGKTREALDEIERFLVEKGFTLANIDEWYIRLARLYETDRELKNMKKALWYYEKLRDGFPMSRYWDEADGKSRYIRRNFFDIK